MGTQFAPTYAILVLGYLEKKLYDGIRLNFNINVANTFSNYFMRFIDIFLFEILPMAVGIYYLIKLITSTQN